MPGVAKDRTYTFRGPSDLAERLERVKWTLALPPDDHVDVVSLVGKEFERRLLRASRSGLTIRSQSAALRLAIELVAGSCEKVADDLEWADLYAQEPPRESEDTDWLARVFASLDRRRSVA